MDAVLTERMHLCIEVNIGACMMKADLHLFVEFRVLLGNA